MSKMIQRFRHLLLLSVLFCIVACSASYGHAQADSQDVAGDSDLFRYAGWRSKWLCRLTTIPADPVIPDTVIFTIRNLSRDTLRGFPPFLTIYGLEGSASSSFGIQGEFELNPGDGITIRIGFRKLRFVGDGARRLDTAKLYEEMRTIPWSLRAGFTDWHSPKPPMESSLNVTSNLVECNRQAIK